MKAVTVFSFSGFTTYAPSGKLSMQVCITDGRIGFQVKSAGDSLFSVETLGMVSQDGDTLQRFSVVSVDSQTVRSSYSLPWGSASSFKDHYRQSNLLLRSGSGNSFQLQFRVYDDGVAYRYLSRFPGDSLSLLKETGVTRFSRAMRCWWSWADYNTLEKEVYSTPLKEAEHVALPFTVRIDSAAYVSVLEARVEDYTTMTFRQSKSDTAAYAVNLVPWSDGVAVRVKDSLCSPWRAYIVSSDPAGLLASNLVMNLNEPATSDFSWARPMKYVGIWWEMHLGLSTWKLEGGRHGATTANTKRYIDFAAENGIQGVLVEGWNKGWERWGEKDAFDFTTPYDDFNLEEITRYADLRRIRMIGHHETGGDVVAYEYRLDSAFSLYRRLGIRYVKTGYAGPVNPPTEHHHGQYMVRHLNNVMRTAAAYGICLDVHEPVIPSGLSRTYPNLMTFEGVRGMEWNAWSGGNPPSHTCMIPFTRGLAGPMDYTPGIFDTREDRHASERVSWNGLDKGNNAVHATLSNQLAMLVVNYSPLQMAADLPENYQGHPAFRFISLLPAAWDETRVLAASIGEYVVVARRKGTTWYVAAITNELSRSITLNTDFLNKDAVYLVDACTDATGSHFDNDPESYTIRRSAHRPDQEFELWMAPGGGELVVFTERKASVSK